MHATYETFEMESISFTNGLESKTTTHDFSLVRMREKWGYAEEGRLFIDALEGRSPVPVSADDGYQVVELIEACYRSAKDGSRVCVSARVGNT